MSFADSNTDGVEIAARKLTKCLFRRKINNLEW